MIQVEPSFLLLTKAGFQDVNRITTGINNAGSHYMHVSGIINYGVTGLSVHRNKSYKVIQRSLQKQPLLLASRRWGRFARRKERLSAFAGLI